MRDVITTWLETGGLLLLAAAAGVWVGRFTVAGGLAVSGVLLIACSAVVAWRAPARSTDESTA